MVAQFKVFLFHTKRKQKVFAVVFPIRKPFKVATRLAKKFKLHLLELAHAEYKVSGRNFVSERFTYLPDAERHAAARRPLHVFKVYENALRRFGAQINRVYAVFGNALKSFKHKVKLSDRRKIAFTANGARNFLFGYKRFQSVVVHTLYFYIQFMLFAVIFRKIIRAVA